LTKKRTLYTTADSADGAKPLSRREDRELKDFREKFSGFSPWSMQYVY
jgi:hypothetical protein